MACVACIGHPSAHPSAPPRDVIQKAAPVLGEANLSTVVDWSIQLYKLSTNEGLEVGWVQIEILD
jgi:hypothetical protein